jgi:glyoxylase-like metal-dependent hydrolase (beta-lactamase superfamily II)
MADPQKLIAGSIAVYGEQKFRQLYGEIQPIDATRIISPQDGDTLRMGKREFQFLDTPGHARHHFCIFDRKINAVYTGDTMGIAYRTLRDPEHAFVMPTTTPVQFDPAALHDSIDKVMALQPDYLFCTHYSLLQPSAANIAGLHKQIDDFCMLTEQASAQAEQFVSELSKRLKDYAVRRARNELETVSTSTIEEWVSLDSSLSAQGLAHWWQHNRAT